MNLIPWRNRGGLNGDLARLRGEMEQTFERFFNEPFGLAEPKALRTEGWLPALDVSETNDGVTIRAEVPGVDAKDLDIGVVGRTLSIAGKKEEHQEKTGENFYRCERSFGSFRRTIELPETIDADKVSAESDNGVVTIRVAKKPGAKARQIEVKPVAKKVAVAS